MQVCIPRCLSDWACLWWGVCKRKYWRFPIHLFIFIIAMRANQNRHLFCNTFKEGKYTCYLGRKTITKIQILEMAKIIANHRMIDLILQQTPQTNKNKLKEFIHTHKKNSLEGFFYSAHSVSALSIHSLSLFLIFFGVFPVFVFLAGLVFRNTNY